MGRVIRTRIITSIGLLLATSSSAFAQASDTVSLDERINQAIAPITDWLSSIIFYAVDFRGTASPADDFPAPIGPDCSR